MTSRDRSPVRTVGLVLLVLFGIALILGSISVFCLLTSEPLVGCIADTLGPF